jgi:hypothetical protein
MVWCSFRHKNTSAWCSAQLWRGIHLHGVCSVRKRDTSSWDCAHWSTETGLYFYLLKHSVVIWTENWDNWKCRVGNNNVVIGFNSRGFFTLVLYFLGCISFGYAFFIWTVDSVKRKPLLDMWTLETFINEQMCNKIHCTVFKYNT